VYKDKLGSTSSFSSEIFKVLDQDLGTKKSMNEAKNYKKLLAAIQKSKILHPTETATLFAKANKFMSKESVKKEMVKIKKEIKEKVQLEGPKVVETSVENKLKRLLLNPEKKEHKDLKELEDLINEEAP